MSKGDIVERVVRYITEQIVDDASSVQVEVVDDGEDAVLAEVKTAKPDMGRVIGRRGRVARAIRLVAKAAGDEEGLDAQVEFLD
ncbi:MAG TPA: KH domain-containing protein [Acidimicrobiia bacterium]